MNQNTKQIFPILPLRRMVIFPEQLTKLALVRKKSIAAAKSAVGEKTSVLLLPQYNYDAKAGQTPIYHNVGVIATICDAVEDGGILNLYVAGLRRVIVSSILRGEQFDQAEVLDFIETDLSGIETDALYRKLLDFLNDKESVEDTFLADVTLDIDKDKCSKLELVNAINAYLPYDEALKQISEPSLTVMLENLLVVINRDLEIAKIDRKITLKVKNSFEKAQKETYLREKMSVIQKELGGDDDFENYRKKIENLPIDEEYIFKLKKDLDKSAKMQPSSADFNLLRNYLDFVLDLPWGVYTEDSTDLIKAKEILDRDHFGLDKIKDRILEFLAVHAMSKNHREPILCFVGPPGVGKTTIVRSIADSLDRAYVRMSLGGVHDEAEIRGHRKTYIGAMPGRIISTIKQSGTMNPVFLLDEVDKLAKDYRGDPSAALLEVLDPEMNDTFRDNYLEIPFNLKDVIFITTANSMDSIPAPLLDRMEVIEMSGYTPLEKLEIAKRHLVRKQLENCGLTKEQVEICDGVLEDTIALYTHEAGVRQLEKEVAQIMRRAARRIVEKQTDKVVVTTENLKEFLGIPKTVKDKKLPNDEVGTATGLAWTAYGGTLLNIEVSVMDGKGDLILTGSLGDVLKESGRAALSYLRANADALGIDKEIFSTKDIHVHLPEGATPKDGPSAGITLATAIYSALTGKKVRADVSMTGEITLRGRVLPIGGLKEKLLASHRAKVFEVIIPEENRKDVEEIPKCILDDVKVNFVSNVNQVFDLAIAK
ncbi:MAG: endopeptidase La [Acidaminococcus sp.]|nr:endopeptidase La [Acidaminococcus sp.]